MLLDIPIADLLSSRLDIKLRDGTGADFTAPSSWKLTRMTQGSVEISSTGVGFGFDVSQITLNVQRVWDDEEGCYVLRIYAYISGPAPAVSLSLPLDEEQGHTHPSTLITPPPSPFNETDVTYDPAAGHGMSMSDFMLFSAPGMEYFSAFGASTSYGDSVNESSLAYTSPASWSTLQEQAPEPGDNINPAQYIGMLREADFTCNPAWFLPTSGDQSTTSFPSCSPSASPSSRGSSPVPAESAPFIFSSTTSSA
ncbi:hypothetical protein FB45DRAFT_1012300, partial [Roridomyces roridus]